MGVASVPGEAEVTEVGGAIGSRFEGKRIGEAVEADARIVAEGPAVDGEGEAATVAPDSDEVPRLEFGRGGVRAGSEPLADDSVMGERVVVAPDLDREFELLGEPERQWEGGGAPVRSRPLGADWEAGHPEGMRPGGGTMGRGLVLKAVEVEASQRRHEKEGQDRQRPAPPGGGARLH